MTSEQFFRDFPLTLSFPSVGSIDLPCLTATVSGESLLRRNELLCPQVPKLPEHLDEYPILVVSGLGTHCSAGTLLHIEITSWHKPRKRLPE